MKKRNQKYTRSAGSHIRSDRGAGEPNGSQEAMPPASAPIVDRKALQLCRQIERTIGLVLSGELDDDRIRDLMVHSVVPAPFSSHVLVTLQAPEQMTEPELFELDALLFEYKGRIRTAVAQAISRKKAPDLTLRVVNGPS